MTNIRQYCLDVTDSIFYYLEVRDYCGLRWFRKSFTEVLDLKDPLRMSRIL